MNKYLVIEYVIAEHYGPENTALTKLIKDRIKLGVNRGLPEGRWSPELKNFDPVQFLSKYKKEQPYIEGSKNIVLSIRFYDYYASSQFAAVYEEDEHEQSLQSCDLFDDQCLEIIYAEALPYGICQV